MRFFFAPVSAFAADFAFTGVSAFAADDLRGLRRSLVSSSGALLIREK